MCNASWHDRFAIKSLNHQSVISGASEARPIPTFDTNFNGANMQYSNLQYAACPGCPGSGNYITASGANQDLQDCRVR